MTNEVGSGLSSGSRSSTLLAGTKPATLKKRVAFYFLMLILVVMSVELISQALFFVKYRRFVWSGVDHFSVRSFTEIVDDARYVTMKPNFENPSYEGWGLSTDA